MAYRTSITAPVFGLRREIDRLFEDAFGYDIGGRRSAALWAPVTDVREDDHEMVLTFELPGVSPDEVEITVENGVLTVQGVKEEVRTENDEATRHHLIERTFGAFTRSFQVSKGLDESKVEAQFDRGVLVVRIPKAAEAQPRRIRIKSAGESAAPSGREVSGQKQQASVGSGQAQTTSSGQSSSGQSRSSGAGAQSQPAMAGGAARAQGSSSSSSGQATPTSGSIR